MEAQDLRELLSSAGLIVPESAYEAMLSSTLRANPGSSNTSCDSESTRGVAQVGVLQLDGDRGPG